MRTLSLVVLLLAVTGCHPMRTADRAVLEARYMDDASRLVEVDAVPGLEVHLRDEGEGPPILLLHGAAASLHSWDAWAADLSRDHRVLRIDLPPFGLTGPHPEGRYDPESYLALVTAILDAAEVDRVVIAGNSLGGYVAGRYAAEAPERVRGVILLAPAGYPQDLPWPLRLVAMRVLGRMTTWLTPRWIVARAVEDTYGDPDRVPAGTVERYHDLIRAPGAREGMRELARVMDELAGEEPRWVRRVEAPALVLWGKEDSFTPVELAERWGRDLPDSEVLLLPGVGHVPMEEVPHRTLVPARRFLRRLESVEPAELRLPLPR